MQPDLSGLSSYEPWEYFDAVEATALTALRDLMGASYASSPDDDDLKDALSEALEVLEGATGRWFVKRTGTISVDGSGGKRLILPGSCAVISTGQGGNGITAIKVGTSSDAVDADSYLANDGAGRKPHDPRDLPYVELIPWKGEGVVVTVPPEGLFGGGTWPVGFRNVHVTGDFGYVEADGSTPRLIQKVLALLTIRALVAGDDDDGREDSWRGSLVREQTQGRSYTRGLHGTGAGLTTDREIDQILLRFRVPPRAARAGRQRTRRREWWQRR